MMVWLRWAGLLSGGLLLLVYSLAGPWLPPGRLATLFQPGTEVNQTADQSEQQLAPSQERNDKEAKKTTKEKEEEMEVVNKEEQGEMEKNEKIEKIEKIEKVEKKEEAEKDDECVQGCGLQLAGTQYAFRV